MNIAKLPELGRGIEIGPKIGASFHSEDNHKGYGGHYGEAGEDGDRVLAGS